MSNDFTDGPGPRWDVRAALTLGVVFAVLAWVYGSAGEQEALILIGVCMALIGVMLAMMLFDFSYEY